MIERLLKLSEPNENPASALASSAMHLASICAKIEPSM
jgi:hypothetical protein